MTKTTRDTSNTSFQLKGGLFTLTVIYLFNPELTVLGEQLAKLVKQTPKFFQNMPVVIDLHKLQPPSATLDFTSLIQCLREHGLIPIGVRSGNALQHEAAASIGLAIMPNTKTEATAEPATIKPTVATDAAPAAPAVVLTKIITQPIRSGQQIYARNSDLVVLGPVSPGAELIADGNIHIYGALRGRALAGVSGNQSARIFCQTLEAELVSIAGHYWISEDLHNSAMKENVHIYLEKERLHVSTY